MYEDVPIADEYNSDDEEIADKADDGDVSPEEDVEEYERVTGEGIVIEDQFAQFGCVDGAGYIKVLSRLQREERLRQKKLNSQPGSIPIGTWYKRNMTANSTKRK